jgi:protein-S-isoprenylcysteine O-methyltransferase Ste14
MWGVQTAWPGLGVALPGRWWLGGLVALAGGFVALAGVVDFRRARTTVDPTRPEAASALVTTGVYAQTRNPMYVGFVLALAGWGVALAHPVAALLVPGLAAYLHRFQILPEERALKAAFGDAFAAYAARVRRWV